jgi:hypothetical protein
MTRIAIIAAAALAGVSSAAADFVPNIVTTYTRVQIQVWGETVDAEAVATNWCKAKGHGNAVHIVYAGLRKLPGNQPGGKAYYQKIVCQTVPFQA